MTAPAVGGHADDRNRPDRAGPVDRLRRGPGRHLHSPAALPARARFRAHARFAARTRFPAPAAASIRPGRLSGPGTGPPPRPTGNGMSREQRRGQAAMTAEHSAGTPGPRWRALLEARWQSYVQEVTALLRRAVGARRKLADIEDALGRLAAGRFGSCEQCGSPVPAGLLRAAPETRYCARCDAPSGDSEPPGVPGELPLAGRATR